MRKLGELGCTAHEARERGRRLLNMGLLSMSKEAGGLMTPKERVFIQDMAFSFLDTDSAYEPTFGQITWLEDLKEKYLE